MKYYAGLDAAMKETFMCIVDEEGKRVLESKAPTDPQAICEEHRGNHLMVVTYAYEKRVGH